MDSKTLFVKQVSSHAEILTNLLGCASGQTVSPEAMQHCVISTKLLAGTSSLMGLPSWQALFESYQGLLETYQNRSLAWGERVAQVTSEMIEFEEALSEAEPVSELTDSAWAEQSQALQAEIAELNIDAATMEPSPPAAPPAAAAVAPAGDSGGATSASAAGPAENGDAVDLYELGADAVADETPASGDPVDAELWISVSKDAPLAGIIRGFSDSAQSVLRELASPAWRERTWDSRRFEQIRIDLNMVDFYARSIDKIIERNAGERRRGLRCPMTALATAIADFSGELAHSTGRALEVRLEHDAVEIDPRLMPVADMILQSMIGDVFRRCSGESLEFVITVRERHGAAWFSVSDDGDNMISDSRLDHDDQLAFYPRLRHVIRAITQHHGVLSVEPGNGRRSRFEFSLPLEGSRESMITWGDGQQAFSVRSSQLCDLVPASTPARGTDSRGEYIEVDHQRVPLLRLDTLFPQAPESNEMIAVVGSVEKRVAFYVPDSGRPVDGQLLGDTIPAWQGPVHAVVQVDDARMPLLEANKILIGYLEVTGELNPGDVSGGVIDDDMEQSNSQAEPPPSAKADAEATDPVAAQPAGAASAPDVTTPPLSSQPASSRDVDVLVVEQSQAMREVLTEILGSHELRAEFAGGVEEAVRFLDTNDARLIISEFRMPTMAAKKLVDSLRTDGRSIPVLVTTSQSGKTADLLVEKLGVSGYLGKPLQVEEVTARLQNYLGARTP